MNLQNGLKVENTFAVEIEGLTKSFKDFKALDTIDLNIKLGEKVVIYASYQRGFSRPRWPTNNYFFTKLNI